MRIRTASLLPTLGLIALCLQIAACGGTGTGSSGNGGSGGGGSNALAVSTTSLPNAGVGVAYSASLQASGGTAPYTWTLASGIQGILPPGIALSSAGVLTGTATEPGQFGSLAFVVKDSSGTTANSKALGIVVNPATLAVTTTNLPQGSVGDTYVAGLASTGGNPPITWTVKSGTLPAGLMLGQGGTISGVPTAGGTATLVFQATDSSSPAQTAASPSLALQIIQPFAISTTSLPGGLIHSPYTATLQAVGGTPPYKWAANPSGGQLPPGLSLSSSGVISGTPNTAGLFSSLLFTVTDATGATANNNPHPFGINITALPLMITTTSLPMGTTGTAYTGFLSSTGGNPPIMWSIKSGTLPPGLTLGQGGGLLGSPTTAGSYTLVFEATDSSSPPLMATSIPLTIKIVAGSLSVVTTSLPDGTVGIPYSASLRASGGTPPYKWTFLPNSGPLPPGLTLSPTGDGVISGTPALAGTRGTTYIVTDAVGSTAQSQNLNININAGALAVSTTVLPTGNAGVAYNAMLEAAGGVAPYSWTLSSGTLPGGIVLAGNGQLSGTPPVGSSSTLVFQVKDGNGTTAKSGSLTLTISGTTLMVTTTSLPDGTVGAPYSAMLSASGGAPPYTWSVAGTLPPGISLDTSNGVISGTPSAAGTFDNLVFTVKDSSHAIASSGDLTLVISYPAFSVTTTSLKGDLVGNPYNQTLQAVGGAPPYSWSTNNHLPLGVTLNTNGTLSGTPVLAGPYGPLIFTASDTVGDTATSIGLFIQITENTCGSGSENAFGKSPVAFLIKGFDSGGHVTLAGSFTPNGTGGISSGVEDVNRSSQSGGKKLTISNVGSSYSIGSDYRGCLTLATSDGNSTMFRFRLTGFSGAVATAGRIIQFDDASGNGTRGSGILRQQNTASFADGLGGSTGTAQLAFLLTGGNSSGHSGMAGSFTSTKTAVSNLAIDSDEAGSVKSGLSGGSGVVTTPDSATGRGTATLNASPLSINTVYYQVADDEFIFVSNDAGMVNPIAGGEALATAGPFGPIDLVNSFIYYTEGGKSGSSTATVGTMMFDGSAAYSGGYFQNMAGSSSGTTETAFSGSYTVNSSTGRITFTGNIGAGAAPVGYVINDPSNPAAFLVGTDNSATSGYLQFQSNSGSVNLTNLSGSYGFGSDDNGSNAATNAVGTVSISNNNPNFTYTGTDDVSSSGVGGLAPNQMLFAMPFTFASDGTGTFGVSTEAVTDGNIIYYINTAPAVTSPTVSIVSK